MNIPLLKACEHGHFDIVRYLLTDVSNPVDINFCDENGKTPLMHACEQGHLDIVKYLLTSKELKKHARLDLVSQYHFNALSYACMSGALDVVKYLVSSTAISIDYECEYGLKHLKLATLYAKTDVVKYLLNAKTLAQYPKICQPDERGNTLFHDTCFSGSLELLQYLLTFENLKKDEYFHHKNLIGQNMLMLACMQGNFNIVKYLLETKWDKPFNLYDVDNDGCNILIYCCEKQSADIIKYLIVEQEMKVDEPTFNLLKTIFNEMYILNLIKELEIKTLYHDMQRNLSCSYSTAKQRKI